MARGNVLVTGASSGIGAATALLLAQEGYTVWGTTRNLERVSSLPQELQKAVRFVALDVTDDASVEQCINQVMSEAKVLDVLVHNAGGAVYGPIEEVPMELAIYQFDLNVFGWLRVIQRVVPHMRERRKGTIVTVSSLAGKFSIPYQSHYSASKHAIEAFSEALRQELRPFGVRVTSVLPGDINTNFNKATKFPPGFDPERSPYSRWVKASWNTIDENLRKAPSPEVVAKTILHAISVENPRARYTAGDFASRQFPTIARFIPDGVKEWAIRVFYRVNFR